VIDYSELLQVNEIIHNQIASDIVAEMELLTGDKPGAARSRSSSPYGTGANTTKQGKGHLVGKLSEEGSGAGFQKSYKNF
jgi:hypothetical protein